MFDSGNLYWTVNHRHSRLEQHERMQTQLSMIKVQFLLRDLSSDTEIASKEAKVYKNVTLRAFLERGEKPPACLTGKILQFPCPFRHATPPAFPRL